MPFLHIVLKSCIVTAVFYSTVEIIQNKLPQLEKTAGPKQPYLTKTLNICFVVRYAAKKYAVQQIYVQCAVQ